MDHPQAFVAVVDDEPSICRALLRLLRAADFRAEAYGSATTFLESLPNEAPDCLVVDLHMPGMTGIELQEQLLRQEQRVPVIIVTAHDEPGVAARCLGLGASFYLRKPIEGDVLIGAIRGLVCRNGA